MSRQKYAPSWDKYFIFNVIEYYIEYDINYFIDLLTIFGDLAMSTPIRLQAVLKNEVGHSKY